jgi:hypothetical protein
MDREFRDLHPLPKSVEPAAGQHGDDRGAAQAGGFSLHACIDIQPGQRQKLERRCRYVKVLAVTTGGFS